MVINPAPTAYFMGSKACDSDPMLDGNGGVRADVVPGASGAMFFNPIRGFTHQDVFGACVMLDIPIDNGRYEVHERQWREKPDRLENVDYVSACTKCVDDRPDAPAVVECPYFKMQVANAAERVPWVKPEAPGYMKP
jgi:hypothetical protein